MQKIMLVETIRKEAPAREIVAEIKRRLDAGGSALISTFQIEKHDNGLWTASIVDVIGFHGMQYAFYEL